MSFKFVIGICVLTLNLTNALAAPHTFGYRPKMSFVDNSGRMHSSEAQYASGCLEQTRVDALTGFTFGFADGITSHLREYCSKLQIEEFFPDLFNDSKLTQISTATRYRDDPCAKRFLKAYNQGHMLGRQLVSPDLVLETDDDCKRTGAWLGKVHTSWHNFWSHNQRLLDL